ncbi:YceI family protein [Larkinella arboricola]|uniref:YceI-like domain-containing protein n=1 Tax=Larkinella arboricola TaxID=643671 RepID=A0A327WXI3_LARAB|nr:YceI family protein [Larkinella arboricola]RAJ97516.1 YceI-like domain-containing protein [Larkinella arboricola]
MYKQVLVGFVALALAVSSPATAIDRNTDNTKKAVAKTTTYNIDVDKSVLTWNGKKVTGEHSGPVKAEKGYLTLNGNKLTGGVVSIDLRTMTSSDLKDNKEYHDKLINHLKSDDFFSVAKYPVSTFKITKVKQGSGNTAEVTGDLTIKGITNPVTFPVTVSVAGNTLTATGKATINRAKYDIKYGSKSFFDNLGDKVIYDDFTVDMNIVATADNASSAKAK